MTKNYFTEEVFHSWRRCVEAQISIDVSPVKIEIGQEAYAGLLKQNTHLISVFDKVIGKIKHYMGNECLFLYYQIQTI